jgi:catechol 2,3-dioxygenase
MADPRVIGLRSVEFGVADVAATARFYQERWGLPLVAEEGGSAFLRASGPEHHIVVLHQRATPGVVRTNLAAPDKATVDAMHARMVGLGAEALGAPGVLAQPGGGYGFDFRDPDGQLFSISAEVARHADAADAEDRPDKLSHVVLNSDKVDAQTEWFCDVLGFKLSDRTERMHFIRCSTDHHSIAHARADGPSLNHVAFEMPSFNALMFGAGRMKSTGYPVEWGVGRHGPGNNIYTYFIEPNGLAIEYTAEVEQVDDSYKAGTPEDWKRPEGGFDRWRFSEPPSPRLRKAMHGEPQPPVAAAAE